MRAEAPFAVSIAASRSCTRIAFASSSGASDRLWLGGFGHVDVSKSGALLERTLIDGSV